MQKLVKFKRPHGLMAAALLSLPGMVFAGGGLEDQCERRTNDTAQELRECVTVDGIKKHLLKLQAIANDNNNNRASGTAGFEASLDYVAKKLSAAGYIVKKQQFDFDFYQEISSQVKLTAPSVINYQKETDYLVFTYSGSGNISGIVRPVGGIIIPATPEPSSASGCTADDFAGFPAGSIALIQRGGCGFGEKVANAKAAGASAVIIFNEGQEGRTDATDGTLIEPSDIPAISVSYAIGANLYQTSNPVVQVNVNTTNEKRKTTNLIAETPTGNPNSVIMVGAHLDSVLTGPGINDNGSGASALLEVALQMKGIKPVNKLRLVWWGAEENGTLGSLYYVDDLKAKNKLDEIVIYLNFDMLGSPNHILNVFDAQPNIAEYPDSMVKKMTVATKLFENYFKSVGEPFEPRDGDPAFFDRGDHANFAWEGVPIGGLDLGADDIKTAEQVKRFGGTAGIFADPCYHKACDTINNVNIPLTARMADAMATVVIAYAFDSTPNPKIEKWKHKHKWNKHCGPRWRN